MSKRQIWILGAAAVVVVVVAIGATLVMLRERATNIVVFLPSGENPFWVEVRRGVEESARSLGRQYHAPILISGELNAATQVEQLNSVFSRGSADAVVLGIANSRAPAAVIAQFNNKHIPVVLVDTKLDQGAAAEAGAHWDGFVGSDNRLGGRLAAETMIEALKERGNKVLLIRGNFVHQSAIDRAEGFIHEANGRLMVTEQEGEWSRQRATEITTGVMLREPVNGIFASNDDMALGAVAALANLNIPLEKRPIIIGFDATPEGKQAIEHGEMFASIQQNAEKMGSVGVLLADQLIRGVSGLEREELIPVTVFHKQ